MGERASERERERERKRVRERERERMDERVSERERGGTGTDTGTRNTVPVRSRVYREFLKLRKKQTTVFALKSYQLFA